MNVDVSSSVQNAFAKRRSPDKESAGEPEKVCLCAAPAVVTVGAQWTPPDPSHLHEWEDIHSMIQQVLRVQRRRPQAGILL